MNIVILPTTDAGRTLLRQIMTEAHAWDQGHPGCLYGVDIDQLARDIERDEKASAEMDRDFERFEAWCRQMES